MKKHSAKEAENIEDELTVNDGELDAAATEPKKANKLVVKFKKFVATKKGKVVLISSIVAILLLSIFAIAPLRDNTVAYLVHKDVTVRIVDDRSGKPVSGAMVEIDGKSAASDGDGIAIIKSVKAAAQTIKITAANYQEATQSYRVPFYTSPTDQTVEFHATGKPIELTVTNSISGDPLSGANLSSKDAKAVTNESGVANIVLPYNDNEQTVTISLDGYNTTSTKVFTNSLEDVKVPITLTPVGTVVYLSKATGVINVMRSNLDGSDAKVLVAGTGTEDDNNTTLISTHDWEYSSFYTRDAANKQHLYLINNKTGEKTLIDGGENVDILQTGWYNHKLAYRLERTGLEWSDSGKHALKVYDADSKKLSLIDETTAVAGNYGDYAYEYYQDSQIINNELVFYKNWISSNNYNFGTAYSANAALQAVELNTLDKRTIKSFEVTANSGVMTVRKDLLTLLLRETKDYNYDNSTYWQYKEGEITQLNDMNNDKFYSPSTSYLLSPSDKKTIWTDTRNGKNYLLIGDSKGEDGIEVASGTDYSPYAWFGLDDKYVMLWKDRNTLYIADPSKLNNANYQPLKITSMHVGQYGYGDVYGFEYGG